MELANSAVPTTPNRLPPRTGILVSRENRLAELAGGLAQTRVQELVDPARCRIWQYHNRDYAALSVGNCADLIDSIKSQGRQEVPAIVRRIPDDPEHAFEVICGARRHWTISWLRAHDYPDLKFLVEPRELTDEEAFRVADLENRSRKDLSDYERATDYARALELYYDGSQQRMADRLEVSKSWLSRYLELARLPTEVLGAFGTPHALGISHAATLAPLLKIPKAAAAVLAEAELLTAEQQTHSRDKRTYISASICVHRLSCAAREKPPSKQNPGLITVRGKDGAPLMKAKMTGRGGGLSVDIPKAGKIDRAQLIAAFTELLENLEKPSVSRRR